jgi:large subunit ribosomal protein L15
MNLNQLPKTTKRSMKRVGRGYGSGKGGHTTGRGSKGQGARSKVATWFEGGQLPQIRRFPFIRGKSRFKPLQSRQVPINLTALEKLAANTEVTLKTLVENRLISSSKLAKQSVKILGRGSISVPLIIKVPISKKAAEKIIQAGGRVESGAIS